MARFLGECLMVRWHLDIGRWSSFEREVCGVAGALECGLVLTINFYIFASVSS